LGDVYFRKGMHQDAAREWDRALTLDETNAILRQKLDDLRKRISRDGQ
jgi:predicted negative regulator of RcsB-dependent stress response